MTSRNPRSLADLLSAGSLKDLALEAQRRRGLTEHIRELLPSEEGAHLVSVSTGEAGELILVMDASVWAARVRYRAESLGAKRVRVKVRPRTGQSGNPGTS